MITKVKDEQKIYQCFEGIGLDRDLKEKGSALIKINLARPPEIGHPRTVIPLPGETKGLSKQPIYKKTSSENLL